MPAAASAALDIEEVRALHDSAVAAPVEIGAEALLQLASIATLPRPTRMELVAAAFDMAQSARYPTRLSGVVGPASASSSEAGVLGKALAVGLSRLDLQVKAVRLMLSIDPLRARELFDSMPEPAVPALTCEDALGPRFGEYYPMLGELAANGFTPEERKRGKPIELLEREIYKIRSPFQLEGMARLLAAVDVAPNDVARLITTYASVLKRLQVGDRTFAGATTHGLTQAVYDLNRRAGRAQLPVLPLIDAYRSYLTTHLAGKRCADTADPGSGTAATLKNMVELFNRTLIADPALSADIRPISPEESTPARLIEARAEIPQMWSKQAASMAAELLELRGEMPVSADTAAGRPNDERGSQQPEYAAWEARARAFLSRLESLRQEPEQSALEYFHVRASLYEMAIDSIPAGSLRTSTLQGFTALLSRPDVQQAYTIHWALHARELIRRLAKGEMAMISNSTLRLYARVLQMRG